jgi:metallophosphoesterase superfamily enzyme
VICLGDSFDDAEAASQLPDGLRDWLLRLMAGRDWSWVEGNHDPGPIGLGGSHRAALRIGAVRFCHQPGLAPGPEVGGHYHPKLRLAGRSHRCFVLAPDRVILPAFGAYTGGLWCHEPPLAGLAGPGALAVLTGARAIAVPLPEPGPEPGPRAGMRAGMRAARGG